MSPARLRAPARKAPRRSRGASAVLLLLTASTIASAQEAQTPTILAKDHLAEASGYRFEPERLEVAPGARIVVRAQGDEPHTVTPTASGAFADTRVEIGGTAELTAPSKPGEYPFYCKFHAGPGAKPGEAMAGVLVVREDAPPVQTTGPGGVLAVAALATTAQLLASRRR